MSIPTRAQRWKTAVEEAETAISTLKDIQTEAGEELSKIPEDDRDSSDALLWQEVCDLDLQYVEDVISDAKGIVM